LCETAGGKEISCDVEGLDPRLRGGDGVLMIVVPAKAGTQGTEVWNPGPSEDAPVVSPSKEEFALPTAG